MKKWLPVFISFVLLFTVASVQSQQKSAGKKETVYKKEGVASYYGGKFNGKLMANGEKFNEKNLTAAHNTLSLGTWVKVSNLRNKKSVIVQITDRMHHKNKRLIDVSKEAARKLGFLKRGVAKVLVEIVENPYN
ncbi:MAG: septal ring lytic transglycosylase RlpA family protein [Chitinophagaceae bacterium]|nr:septal ring lytic transglycosylase RlpA family protein [Chitinophagaceae bacterium]